MLQQEVTALQLAGAASAGPHSLTHPLLFQGFQGNRRPGAGPRSQGQRHIGPPGRSNNGNRHKNGPGQAHGRRQTSPLAASTAASPGQTQPTGTSGASAQPGRPGPPPSGTESKGLPQRKPRASRQEGANS